MARRAYSVGALAVADRRANAVGPLRLTCEREVLRIDLLYVGPFSLGYAAASVADAVSVRVPYSAVRGLMRDGDRLLLSIDPRVMRPYNRFALARFGPEPLAAMMRLYRRRALVAVLLRALPWLLGGLGGWLGMAALSLRLPLAGALGALLAIAGSFLVGRLLRLVDSLRAGAPLRDALEDEISRRMGLSTAAPLPDADPEVVLQLARRRDAEEMALSAGARPRWLALSALGSLLAVVLSLHLVQRLGVTGEVLLDVPVARRGWGPTVSERALAAGQMLLPRHPSCACIRPASPIWAGGMPQLSYLVTPRRGAIEPLWLRVGETYDIGHAKPPEPEPEADAEPEPSGRRRKRRRPRGPDLRVDLDLAVVNNSSATLDTVSLVVTFARRDSQGRRRDITERGLHWPAQLRPGHAVKWSVRAAGNELRIDSPNAATLGQGGIQPAPADEFFAQRDARLSSVRVHSAAMLAYLADPRAPALITTLGHLEPREQAALDQLAHVFEPLVVCEGPAPGHCVHNRSGRLLRQITLSKRGAPAPGPPIADLFYPDQALLLPPASDVPAEQLQVRPVAEP